MSLCQVRVSGPCVGAAPKSAQQAGLPLAVRAFCHGARRSVPASGSAVPGLLAIWGSAVTPIQLQALLTAASSPPTPHRQPREDRTCILDFPEDTLNQLVQASAAGSRVRVTC